ncbi:hypothetical protein C0Q70_12383 [Pomacea canaliculata]|uniref:Uncharacterized protein n=2 Tax=Pomacea canaliculata TaxID=400727 RepID=A0A2T7P1D2_POMCA|nr:hypothetical protein C0Q70_12383 [Pomacea canaliculata]
MDLHLLRQVLFDRPFEKSGAGWKRVADSLRCIEQFSTLEARRVRERTNLLIEQFKRTQNIQQAKSGEEEELTEKDHLLLEIIGIKESIENEEMGEKSQKKKKDEVEQRKRAVEIRAAAMESRKRKQSEDAAGPSSSSSEDVVPSSKKKKPNDLLLELVIKRQVEKREERLAELEIRRQELALEREKFEAASAERNAFLLLLHKFSEK